jgi:hypothetical protein
MLSSPVTATACAAVLSVALTSAASTQAGIGGASVAVTITNAGLKLLPLQIPAGTVAFTITNKSSVARTVTVARKRSTLISPGHSDKLTASIPTGGTYLVLSYTARHTAPLSSALTVIDACTRPATTAIAVTMREGPTQLSSTSVPCGTVTFSITNAGTIVHTFQIDAPNETGLVLGQGRQLNPGESATVTVRFARKGRAYYRCSEPEHDEEYGESGFLAIV